MPSPRTWTTTPFALILLAAALAPGVVVPRAASAEGLKPAAKETPARLRPKNVTLTTAVEPAEARPGATVTLKVTAKLSPGWHIYTYAKTQVGTGPRNTRLDLFDPAGLTPSGEWSASKEPTRHKEPAFPDLDSVSYFADEVTWSLPLKVPADAPAGKKALRCQAGYQVCDDNSCSFPGQWTLPDAELTVSGSDAPAPAAAGGITPKAHFVAAVQGSTAGGTARAHTEPDAEARSATEGDSAPRPFHGRQGRPTPISASDEPQGSVRPEPVSEVQRRANEGVLPLMLASALGGLIALAMPCVWPMIPVTVNFFVKQGQREGGKPTGLAVTYCLAIIGVFTAVGVLCSFFLSATALPRLANNPWLNLAVAGLFVAFGLSLLGVFEIRLPNALLNASAKGEGRGGLVGVMFMALTLTITSFTCTFPVVGGLLVLAQRGQFFAPIIGLATFATVLAAPFFLLALAPGLLSKMPKSGDWMNGVKVVGGLVELGAALKFLNTAELAYVTPENAWVDAQLVLSAWVVLAAVCGLYLLGVFRTDHDHGAGGVGPGRLVVGTGFLVLALYLAPALFGRPPESLVWNRLVVGLLPPDAGELTAHYGGGPGGSSPAAETHASDADPKVAERQEKRFHGVEWGFSYEQALERAKVEGKPILIDFTGVNCANCRLMESNVLPKPDVVKALQGFIAVQLYTLPSVPIGSITTEQRAALAEHNAEMQVDKTNDNTNPFYVALSPTGEVLDTVGGYRDPAVFIAFLEGAARKLKAKGGGKVAQADLPR